MRANSGASQARGAAARRGQSMSHCTRNLTDTPVLCRSRSARLGEKTGRLDAILPGTPAATHIIPAYLRQATMRNSRPESPVSSIGERLSGADPQASVTQLFESMRPDLLRFAHWLARDRSLAEDIVQESLLRAWRSRDALKDPRAARPWLLTIVRREHARLYERKRLELVPLDEAPDLQATPASDDDPGDELFALRHAIMRLPIEYREPLVLQVLGGFSTEEIARELALSSTAVLTRLFRARNKLRAFCGMSPAPDVSTSEGAT